MLVCHSRVPYIAPFLPQILPETGKDTSCFKKDEAWGGNRYDLMSILRIAEATGHSIVKVSESLAAFPQTVLQGIFF